MFLEKGLQRAQSTTEALYVGNVEVLGKLSTDEIRDVFNGAVMCDVLMKPGMTAVDLAMKAQCFKQESEFNSSNFNFKLLIIL